MTAMSMGWECPKCGRCYAPSMMMCGVCGQGFVTTTGTIRIWPYPSGFCCQKCLQDVCVCAPACVHEFTTDSTLPHCKKCGQAQWTEPPYTVTFGCSLQ